jgi:hypothetical protein
MSWRSSAKAFLREPPSKPDKHVSMHPLWAQPQLSWQPGWLVPRPFHSFGNELLRVSCPHIHSASHAFTLLAVRCSDSSSDRSFMNKGREVGLGRPLPLPGVQPLRPRQEVFPSWTSPTRRLAEGKGLLPFQGRSRWSLKLLFPHGPVYSRGPVKAAAAYAVRFAQP